MQIKDLNIRYADKKDYIGIVQLLKQESIEEGILNPVEAALLEGVEVYTYDTGAYVYAEKNNHPIGYGSMLIKTNHIELGNYFIKKGEDQNFVRTAILNEQKNISEILGVKSLSSTIVKDGPLNDYIDFFIQNNFHIKDKKGKLYFMKFDVISH